MAGLGRLSTTLQYVVFTTLLEKTIILLILLLNMMICLHHGGLLLEKQLASVRFPVNFLWPPLPMFAGGSPIALPHEVPKMKWWNQGTFTPSSLMPPVCTPPPPSQILGESTSIWNVAVGTYTRSGVIRCTIMAKYTQSQGVHTVLCRWEVDPQVMKSLGREPRESGLSGSGRELWSSFIGSREVYNAWV